MISFETTITTASLVRWPMITFGIELKDQFNHILNSRIQKVALFARIYITIVVQALDKTTQYQSELLSESHA